MSALLFLYKDGQLIRLGQLPGGYNSWGYAINDSGVVVGLSTVMAQIYGYPFVWQAGAMTNLLAGIPACATSVFNCGGSAFDVNADGDIVGERLINSSGVCCATMLAFLYSQGSFTDLVLPGDTSSVATAINDHGDVVGSSSPSGAFLYRGGTMIGLDALGCSGCAPTDISENRKVVGSTTLASGERHAFLWSHGAMHDLGTLGGNSSEATAVNRTGNTLVGNSTTASGESHGFVYHGGKMVDLNELIDPETGTIVQAQDVNDGGQIAGAITVQRTFFPGFTLTRTYAMLLTPRP